MSICEIKVGDYVESNRDIPKKNILKGQVGRVFGGQYIDSEFYLDIECKEKDGNEFFVYNSAESCWNKVDKPEDIIETATEEPQPASEEQPIPRVYKVPEPDWKEVEALAVEHADSGFGIAGSLQLSYHSFTLESLKEFVMSVLELVAEDTEIHVPIPKPTIVVREIGFGGGCGGAGIQVHVGGAGGGGWSGGPGQDTFHGKFHRGYMFDKRNAVEDTPTLIQTEEGSVLSVSQNGKSFTIIPPEDK